MTRLFRSWLEYAATLLGVVVISFLFMQSLPGDPAEIYAGEEAGPAEIEAVRKRMGLDQPLVVQFVQYIARAAQGDFGESLRTGRPVTAELLSRTGATLCLTGLALLVAAGAALPIGIYSASHPGSRLAQATDWIGLVLLSVPVYWLGMALILIFSLSLRIAPAGGDATLAHFFLPAAALGIHTGIGTARVLRASLLDVLSKPYLGTARGKGASVVRTLWVHALPNAVGPTVTYFAMESGKLLGGAVLTETIFSINGIGRFVIQSIAFRDYPCVLGAVLFMATGVTFANLVGDLLCAWIDPRLRRG